MLWHFPTLIIIHDFWHFVKGGISIQQRHKPLYGIFQRDEDPFHPGPERGVGCEVVFAEDIQKNEFLRAKMKGDYKIGIIISTDGTMAAVVSAGTIMIRNTADGTLLKTINWKAPDPEGSFNINNIKFNKRNQSAELFPVELIPSGETNLSDTTGQSAGACP